MVEEASPADPWADFRPSAPNGVPHCRNHPEEEVFDRGYCELCDWALQVVEAQATAILGDAPEQTSSRHRSGWKGWDVYLGRRFNLMHQHHHLFVTTERVRLEGNW